MPPNAKATRQRVTWKGSQAAPSASLLWYRRVVMSFLGAILLVVFVLLLLMIPPPQSQSWQFKHLCVHSHDFAVKRQGVGKNDARKNDAGPLMVLAALPNDAQRKWSSAVESIDLCENLQTSRSAVSKSLESLPEAKEGESLLLFISGHGVSLVDPEKKGDEEAAYLLTSDWTGPNRASPDSANPKFRPEELSRYAIKVAWLLETLKSRNYKTVMLAIDSGPLERDLHFGMAENRFIELLEQDIESLGPSDTEWIVLTSHAPWQHSACSFEGGNPQQSAFGYYLAEALNGNGPNADALSADGDKPDGKISVAEVARYVQRQVSTWVEQASGGAWEQTPQLFYRERQGDEAKPPGGKLDDHLQKLVLKNVPIPAKVDPPAKTTALRLTGGLALQEVTPPDAKVPSPDTKSAQSTESAAAAGSNTEPTDKSKAAASEAKATAEGPMAVPVAKPAAEDKRPPWLQEQAAYVLKVTQPAAGQRLAPIDTNPLFLKALQRIVEEQRHSGPDPSSDSVSDVAPQGSEKLSEKELTALYDGLHMRNRLLWDLPRWVSVLEFLDNDQHTEFEGIVKTFKDHLRTLEPREVVGTQDGGGLSDATITDLKAGEKSGLVSQQENLRSLQKRWLEWKEEARVSLVSQATNQLLAQELRRLLPLAELIKPGDMRSEVSDLVEGNTIGLSLPTAAAQPDNASLTRDVPQARDKLAELKERKRGVWLQAWTEIAALLPSTAQQTSASVTLNGRARWITDRLHRSCRALDDDAGDWHYDRLARLLPVCLVGQYEVDDPYLLSDGVEKRGRWASPLNRVSVVGRTHLLKLSHNPPQFEFKDLKPQDLIWRVSGEDKTRDEATLEIESVDPRLTVEVWIPELKNYVFFKASESQPRTLLDLLSADANAEKTIKLRIRPTRDGFASKQELREGGRAMLQLKLTSNQQETPIKKAFRLPGRPFLDVRVAGVGFTMLGDMDAAEFNRTMPNIQRGPQPGIIEFQPPAIEDNTSSQLHHVPLSLFARGATRFDLSLDNLTWEPRALRFRWHEWKSENGARPAQLFDQLNTLQRLEDADDRPAHQRWVRWEAKPGESMSPTLFPPPPAPAAAAEGKVPMPEPKKNLDVESDLVLEVAHADPTSPWRQWVWLELRPLRPADYLLAEVSVQETNGASHLDWLFRPQDFAIGNLPPDKTGVQLNPISQHLKPTARVEADLGQSKPQDQGKLELRFSPRFSDNLSQSEKALAVLDVDEFPRAFRFHSDDLPSPRPRDPDSTPYVRLELMKPSLPTQPPAPKKEPTPLERAEVLYWSQLPLDEEGRGRLRFRVLADYGNEDRSGCVTVLDCGGEQARFASDRKLTVSAIKPNPAQPGLLFEGKVAEWSGELDFSGLDLSEPINVIARIQKGTEERAADKQVIVIDEEPPRIAKVERGKKGTMRDASGRFVLQTGFTLSDRGGSGIPYKSIQWAKSLKADSKDLKEDEFENLPRSHQVVDGAPDQNGLIRDEVTIHLDQPVRIKDETKLFYIHIRVHDLATAPGESALRYVTAPVSKWDGTDLADAKEK